MTGERAYFTRLGAFAASIFCLRHRAWRRKAQGFSLLRHRDAPRSGGV